MIKGALFDIDNTLFSHRLKRVPRATIRALNKLRAKGIKTGICTSRAIAEMNTIPSSLMDLIDCKIIGTGAVTMVDGKYFKSYTLDPAHVEKYINFFHKNNISYHYTDINGDFFYWGDLEKVRSGERMSHVSGGMIKKYEDEEITNLFYYEADPKEEEYIASVNPDAIISRWGNCGNICASLVDKSFGLLKFCQMYSLTPDEVVAAGDGINDDVMLEMAGIGIATDDATENTKAKADYVCKKSIDDGGLYDALVDLKVIEEDEYDPKIFFFDNDSTLFDHEIHAVRAKSMECLKKLKEKGYKLCLNTSRSLEECANIPKELLDIMDVTILLNGAYIIYKDHLEISYIPEDEVHRIFSFMDRNDITYRYAMDSGKGYLNKEDKKAQALFEKLYDMIPQTKHYEGEKVVQILYYATGELRDQVIDVAIEEENCLLRNAGEISPAGCSKGQAMIKVARHFGYEKKDIVAFGDSGNDIDMLERSGLGIAMGNGSSDCRQSADYVTDAIGDEGIYTALLRFGFIEEF